MLKEDLDVFVWDDPNNDGDPIDVELLGQGTMRPTNVNDDVLQVVRLELPVEVSSRFFIGANINQPPFIFPPSRDLSQSSNGRAWIAAEPLAGPGRWDPRNIGAAILDEMDRIGFPSVFLLRAGNDEGGCDPCDMNCDEDVNALDIEFFIDLLFNGADPCCGDRGDEGSSGDVNLDGRIDAADIEGFINCLFA